MTNGGSLISPLPAKALNTMKQTKECNRLVVSMFCYSLDVKTRNASVDK